MGTVSVEDISVELNLDTNQFEVRLKSSGALLRKFDADIEKLGRSVQNTEKRVTGITARLRDWVLIVGQVRNAINQISFLTYDWAAAIVRSNAEIERMTYLIKGLSTAADDVSRLEEAKKTVSDLFDAAANAPFSVNALTDTFVKFKSVGIDPTNGSMQALVDATAAFGGTDETLHRASIAIQQMAGKGVISMEELRQQLGEAVPQAINLMARSLGVSYGELVKEISNGTVAAQPAIKAMLEEFERTFGGRASELMDSFSGQYAKMITNIRLLTSQNSGMTDFFEAVKENLKDLNKWLESPAAANFATNVGHGLETVVDALRTGVDWFTKYQSIIVAAGKAALIYWGANKIASVVGGFSTLAGALIKQISLWRTMRSSQMQAAISAVQASASFTATTGAVSTLSSTSLIASGALKTLGRSFISILGPIGFAAAALWTIVDALGIFKSKYREALNTIMDGQAIVDNAQREDVLKGLEQEQARIDDLVQKRNDAINTLNSANQSNSELKGSVLGSVLGDAAHNSLVQNLEFQIESLNGEISTAQENFDRMKETAGKAVEKFDEYKTSVLATDMSSSMDEVERKIRDTYNQAQTAIVDDGEKSSAEKAAALAEEQQSYYSNMIEAWRGFIEEHKQIMAAALADGDDMTAAAADRALSDAREKLLELQKTAAGIGDMGIPTVETSEPTGTEKTALKKFSDLVADLERESAALTNSLADPFAQEIPDSISETERKLRDLAAEAPQLAGQIETVLNAVKDNEGMKALIDMQKAEREYTKSAVSATEKRKLAREEEIATYENKKKALQKLGQWTEDHEKSHQRIIKNINRQSVEDVEATLADRKVAYEKNQSAILSDETLSHDERTAALLNAEETYYTDAISVWQAFMNAQNAALAEAIANGDAVAVAIIQNALAVAQGALNGVFSDLRSTQHEIAGGDSGQSKAEGAIERFNDLLRDTKREADKATRSLADPFAYEIPDSINDTKDKLNDLIKDAPQLKARIEEVMQTVRQTEMMNVLIDLRDKQREITKDIASTAEARKIEEDEQVKTLTNMKARLEEYGMWSKQHEAELQKTLALIREQGIAQTPLGEFGNEWKEFAEDIEDVTVSAIKSINDEITNMIVERTADLEALRKSLASTLISTGLNAATSALVSKVGLATWSGISGTSTTAKVNHSGAVIGQSGGRSRSVSSSMFSTAERYHTGGVIGANEVPIIAEKGETIFTKEQMKALGARSSQSSPRINVINNSGSDVEASDINTRFDAEALVTDIVIKKVSTPGKLRNVLKGK